MRTLQKNYNPYHEYVVYSLRKGRMMTKCVAMKCLSWLARMRHLTSRVSKLQEQVLHYSWPLVPAMSMLELYASAVEFRWNFKLDILPRLSKMGVNTKMIFSRVLSYIMKTLMVQTEILLRMHYVQSHQIPVWRHAIRNF